MLYVSSLHFVFVVSDIRHPTRLDIRMNVPIMFRNKQPMYPTSTRVMFPLRFIIKNQYIMFQAEIKRRRRHLVLFSSYTRCSIGLVHSVMHLLFSVSPGPLCVPYTPSHRVKRARRKMGEKRKDKLPHSMKRMQLLAYLAVGLPVLRAHALKLMSSII